MYSKELKNPQISVILRELSDRKVFVTGEVESPGGIQLNNNMTVIDAIIEAGGFHENRASIDKIRVIRIDDGIRILHKINIKKVLAGKETNPFYLRPYDIVYVPQKNVIKANEWVDAYLNNMFPRFLWTVLPAFFTYQFFINESN